MFQSISWGHYWTVIISLTSAYYLFAYLTYFNGAKHLLYKKGQLSSASLTLHDKRKSTTEDKDDAGPDEIEETVFGVCMDELNGFFENQKKSRPVKTEMISALRAILKKYPSLRTSSYKESLSRLIAAECKTGCSIHLGADELDGVWSGGE